MNNKIITVAVAGLGGRGRTYASCLKRLGDKVKITAIADIIPDKIERYKNDFSLGDVKTFASAEELLKQDKLADILFICTQDKQHYSHAIPALKKGYHLLLEKPISPNEAELREIAAVAGENNRQVVVCHVLRYTVFYQKLKEIIDSKAIGDVVSIQAIENVAWWHQAHSFVRGNWRNSDESSPMILAKCCHDMDILLWLAGKRCLKVSSFGSLKHFRSENAPDGATEYCLDGCPHIHTCPYSVEDCYLKSAAAGMHGWPLDIVHPDCDLENVTEALKRGPYGRCVYHCDNNVVDHQVVNMLLDDDVTVNFTMCAFSKDNYRYTKIMGTHGDIIADMNANTIDVGIFGRDKKREIIDVSTLTDDFSGHGGGDYRMICDLVDIASGESFENKGTLTSIDVSVESHLVALAAERSRLAGGAVIDIN